MIVNLEVKAEALRELVREAIEERSSWEGIHKMNDLVEALETSDALDVLDYLISGEYRNG